MAPWSNARRSKNSPVYYVIIDFRNERRYSRHSRRRDVGCAIPCGRNVAGHQAPRRLVILHAKFLSRRCLPNKVKRSEPGVGWRRKGPRHQKRAPAPPSVARPTLLLPPLRCSAGPPYLDDSATLPCLTTRVQRSDVDSNGRVSGRFQSTDASLRCPVPEPSAPSPGHLFYNSEDHSDMAFIVGPEEWRFPAHSFVLGKTELTLRALLQAAAARPLAPVSRTSVEDSPSSSSSNNEDNTRVKSPLERLEPVCSSDGQRPPLVLKLPDMQPDVFEQMLRYIYTGQVTLSSVESTLRLLHPSRTYHLPQLTSICLSYLSQNVNPSNVLTILSHLQCPDHHSSRQSPQQQPQPLAEDKENERNELVFKCFLVVDRNADVVLQGETFEMLEHKLLVEVLKRDSLEVTTEAVVFDSAMRWACVACKRQRLALTPENKCTVLGKALYLVRYLAMTPEEFLAGPVSQGVLTREDKEAFMGRLTGGQQPIPARWTAWKVSARRHRPQSLLTVTSPGSDLLSSGGNSDVSSAVSPVSVQAVSNGGGKRGGERKKKSMSKKLLNGVGDLVICVIQLLD